MKRFVKLCAILMLILFQLQHVSVSAKKTSTGASDREYWIQTLLKIADPVLLNLSNNTLKQKMPFESLSKDPRRVRVSYLEAFGRTISGIAPWLELGADDTKEGKLRAKYIKLSVQAFQNAVDPNAPDYLVFDNEIGQPLVDAAFMCMALLRAPNQLWGKLDKLTQERIMTELKRTRSINPPQSNWLLFASIVEATLLEFSGEYDAQRLYRGIDRFTKEWYAGDGHYGDGHEYRADYYNSYVINPMLTEVLMILQRHEIEGAELANIQLKRMSRFAAVQERQISPEGTYPVVGRSIVYRFGAFQGIAQASLMKILPKSLSPAQVRSGLTAVIKRQISMPGTFDKNGWLKIGFAGSQIKMSESYINTGSLYLCCNVFLPLGLPADDEFWTAPFAAWTNLKAWQGIDVGADKALRDNK